MSSRATALIAGLALVAASPAAGGQPTTPSGPPGPAPSGPVTLTVDRPSPSFERERGRVRRLRQSAPVPSAGPRLAARLRRGDGPIEVLARGLTAAQVEAAGARVTGQIDPVLSFVASPSVARALAEQAEHADAPQPLRMQLDASRRAIGADQTDEGRDFDAPARGRGVIIAGYDSGVDLSHPDLRVLDGPSRVLALWDQDGEGSPPTEGFGRACSTALLIAELCPSEDFEGHGTSVLAVAASNGPRFRGVAPEADLLMVRSSTFGALLPAMDFAARFAADEGRPMVFNLSLAGQEGPHDGTSLEAQAINAYPHLVVVAAGNDGQRPLHATAVLRPQAPLRVIVRFPALVDRTDRRATVDLWGAPEAPLRAAFALVDEDGAARVKTATVGIGDPGRTEQLLIGSSTIAEVDLDAGADLSPFNQRPHVRLEIRVFDWEDPPNGPVFAVVEFSGEGRVHLWAATPSDEPVPVAFDEEVRLDGQVVGDTDSTISDPATAVGALAVAAFITRTSVTNTDGASLSAGGPSGALAAFTSRGPTLAPEATGAKPELAAPGSLIVAARSRAMPDDGTLISPLYRATAGTSFATPHAAGAAAVLLSAQPSLDPPALKRLLLETAEPAPDGDSRWGAGRLDVAEALAALVGRTGGCRCVGGQRWPPAGALTLLIAVLIVRRRRAPPEL